ncbi:MAG: CDP-alcohol phosphatidyltransferase family protein [Chloroflexota bacterium]
MPGRALPLATGCLEAIVGAVTTSRMIRAYGGWPATRYLAGFAAARGAQQVALGVLRRRVGPEPSSEADLFTAARATCGAVLAGILVSGVRDRTGPAGRLGYALSLVGATALDWLDGPLARRAGATRLGSALDIEADSWLTLWCAAGAVTWGGLPRWCLLPPLLRYLDPLFALRAGRLPSGGGPWWTRVSGVAQMALFVTALAPLPVRPLPLPTALAGVVSAVQTAAVARLLAGHRHGR